MTHGPRHINWQARLTAYLAGCAQRPFQPGEHDCLLFVAGAIAAQTVSDHDYAARWRGEYQSIAGGVALIRADGFRSMIDLVRKTLPEKPRAFAAPGDVAQIGKGGSAAFGIVQGARVYVLRETGIGTVPLCQAHRIFEV